LTALSRFRNPITFQHLSGHGSSVQPRRPIASLLSSQFAQPHLHLIPRSLKSPHAPPPPRPIRLLTQLLALAQAVTPEERLFEALDESKPLVACGRVNLGSKNKDGETALNVAIEKNYKEFAAVLVKAGAILTEMTKNSETPLHYAAMHQDPYHVKLLVNANTDA